MVVPWTLLWADEFDGSAVNLSAWKFEALPAGHFNGELQRYLSATEATAAGTANVSNGALTLTAKRLGQEIVSSRLNSLFKFTYGMVEMRGKIPFADAIWPAWWGLGPDPPGWPTSGEIDIMEMFGHRKGKAACAAVHMEDHHWPSSNPLPERCSGPLDDLQPDAAAGDWHVWRLFWTPKTISITLDAADPLDAVDHLIYRYDKPAAGATNSNWPFQAPFHLLANVAVGGNGVSNRRPHAAWNSSSFLIDYVRVYDLPTNYTIPAESPRSSGLSLGEMATIIVGSMVALALLIAACCWMWRRTTLRQSKGSETNPHE